MNQRLKDIIKDTGHMDKSKLQYIKLKGFTHIWTYHRTIKGQFICSYYSKEKGARTATIRNSTEGWVVHLFIGTANFKSYFQIVELLEDAEEICNLFLDNKLVLKDDKS